MRGARGSTECSRSTARSTSVVRSDAAAAASPRSTWSLRDEGRLSRLAVAYSEDIFGPQPFMAVKLFNERYFHVNLDIVEPFRRFSYVFDENLLCIGTATP